MALFKMLQKGDSQGDLTTVSKKTEQYSKHVEAFVEDTWSEVSPVQLV